MFALNILKIKKILPVMEINDLNAKGIYKFINFNGKLKDIIIWEDGKLYSSCSSMMINIKDKKDFKEDVKKMIMDYNHNFKKGTYFFLVRRKEGLYQIHFMAYIKDDILRCGESSTGISVLSSLPPNIYRSSLVFDLFSKKLFCVDGAIDSVIPTMLYLINNKFSIVNSKKEDITTTGIFLTLISVQLKFNLSSIQLSELNTISNYFYSGQIGSVVEPTKKIIIKRLFKVYDETFKDNKKEKEIDITNNLVKTVNNKLDNVISKNLLCLTDIIESPGLINLCSETGEVEMIEIDYPISELILGLGEIVDMFVEDKKLNCIIHPKNDSVISTIKDKIEDALDLEIEIVIA